MPVCCLSCRSLTPRWSVSCLSPLGSGRADSPEVGVDDLGMSSKLLEQVLANWPEGKQRPKVM